MIRLPGLGMRTIKTAIAVAACLLLYQLLNLAGLKQLFPQEINTPFFACTAAIICMQDTVEKSVKHGIFRLFGTGIGGVTGLLALLANFNDAARTVLAFFGIMLCIFLCNLSKMREASAISCVVFTVILLADSQSNPYIYAVTRIIETAVGILIAVGVNKLINRRDPEHPAKAKES